MNRRGHSVGETRRAAALLRSAGLKIVLHWMPNLLGATPASDRQDFERMWDGFCPDEIKIYPNQLLENAELYNYWQRGDYHPYSTEELIELIADVKRTIPRYCRVNRVIRDIPSTNVVEGNKRTSLRQDVQRFMKQRGESCQCVRCREVRGRAVMIEELTTEEIVYSAGGAEEHFLSFVTSEDKLAGFLRLSLPGEDSPDVCLEDLTGAAIIREVHVYGQSVQVGKKRMGAAQHAGLGRRLVRRAERIARRQGYERIAVIAAIGTRGYYSKLGYRLGSSYMFKMID
jgi:elongator complex protein 3